MNFKIIRPGSTEGHKYLPDLKANDNNLFLIFTVRLEDVRKQNELGTLVGTLVGGLAHKFKEGGGTEGLQFTRDFLLF